jgi:hypothetical protein
LVENRPASAGFSIGALVVIGTINWAVFTWVNRMKPSERNNAEGKTMEIKRMFDVMVKNERTGSEVKMNAAPVDHAQGCA